MKSLVPKGLRVVLNKILLPNNDTLMVVSSPTVHSGDNLKPGVAFRSQFYSKDTGLNLQDQEAYDLIRVDARVFKLIPRPVQQNIPGLV